METKTVVEPGTAPQQKVHQLKVWPEFFQSLLNGKKTFEVRKNDRDFKLGDMLQLQEWEDGRGPGAPGYSGRSLAAQIHYILPLNKVPGLVFHEAHNDDFVVLGISTEAMKPQVTLTSTGQEQEISQKIYDFACAMADRLDAHPEKGSWDRLGLTREQVIANLRQQVHELEQAWIDLEFGKQTPKAVLVKAANVGNYALFSANQVGALD